MRYLSGSSCLTNDGVMIFLYLFSDVAMAAMFMVMAAQLWFRRGRGYYLLPHQCVMAVCVLALYSVSHALGAVAMFHDVYRIDVVVRGAMIGVTSVLLLTACWRHQ